MGSIWVLDNVPKGFQNGLLKGFCYRLCWAADRALFRRASVRVIEGPFVSFHGDAVTC